MDKLRVIIADDERPARSFLAAMLRAFEDVEIVGEAQTGMEALELIDREKPDLALLDLRMPELDGLGVVRLLRKNTAPLIAFITAYDEYAVKAFEVNAVDYLLKPVDRRRLRATINRAQERLDHADMRATDLANLRGAVADYDKAIGPEYLERIPVKGPDDIKILAVSQIVSIVAGGEFLHISTLAGEDHIVGRRLKEIEAKLDPHRFIRLGRGALVNVDQIDRIIPMVGGTCVVHLNNGREFSVSRIQSRLLRSQLLRL
jgi:two-component system LytT family response regulator